MYFYFNKGGPGFFSNDMIRLNMYIKFILSRAGIYTNRRPGGDYVSCSLRVLAYGLRRLISIICEQADYKYLWNTFYTKYRVSKFINLLILSTLGSLIKRQFFSTKNFVYIYIYITSI